MPLSAWLQFVVVVVGRWPIFFFSRIAKWMWHHGWLTAIYDQIDVCSNQKKKSPFIHEQSITNRFHRITSCVYITSTLHYTISTSSSSSSSSYQWHAKSGNSVQWMNEWKTKRISTTTASNKVKPKIKKRKKKKGNNTIQQWQCRLIVWERRKKCKMRKTKMWCPKKKNRGKIPKKEIHTHIFFRCQLVIWMREEERVRTFWIWENVHDNWCKSPCSVIFVHCWFDTI